MELRSRRVETVPRDRKPEMEAPPADESPERQRQMWLAYAVGSGVCAALNGVFAKLTTTRLTGEIAAAVAQALGIPQHENIVQAVCRAVFFLLNLAFNGVMWTFFTAALKKSASATQVAILNSSANFLVTALAGMLVFAEALPPMWWAGAALLVAGSVVAGRKDREAEKSEAEGVTLAGPVGGYHDDDGEEVGGP